MSEKLEKIFETYAYNSQQKMQLRMADDKGLDLNLLKNPLLDWEQMREIALALEFNIDPTPFSDPSIPSEAMREMRIHIFENLEIYETKKEEVTAKRLKNILKLIVIIIFLFFISVYGVLRKDFITSVFSELKLILIEERVDIGLSELSNFRYADLIKQRSGGELAIPKLEISEPGEYNLEYSIKNEAKEIKKSLILCVYDDIKPEIKLKTDTITINTNKSKPNYMSYIAEVYDNYDNDLTVRNVEIDDSKVNYKKAGKYPVTFNVSDTSENTVSKELIVIVEKEKIETSSTVPVPSGNNNNVNSHSSSNSSSSAGKETSSKPVTNNSSTSNQNSSNKDYNSSYMPEDRVFLVDDYETFDECINQCKIYIDSCIDKGFVGTARYDPIKENDIYIGYKVLFVK